MLDILRRVAAGELSPEQATGLISADRVLRVGGHAALDPDRASRTGIPEVVLAGPKRPADVRLIVDSLLDETGSACISRMRAGHRAALTTLARERGARVEWYGRRSCRVALAPEPPAPPGGRLVGLLAAGTSDVEPLEEARMVCEAAGCPTRSIVDVGVAGLHRLFEPLAALLEEDVRAIVVAAGMDGALASVVTGLVAVPVVGLPTSTGYGAGGSGEAALLSMLQSCAPGLTVVNVDNGVGAGAAAALIARGALADRSRAGAEATGERALPGG